MTTTAPRCGTPTTPCRPRAVDFWPVVPFKPLAPFFGFERSIVFQRVPAWNDLLNGPDDAKLPLLADPGVA